MRGDDFLNVPLAEVAPSLVFRAGDATMSNAGMEADQSRRPLGPQQEGINTQPVLLVELIGAFPSSGEIRRKVDDPPAVLARIKKLHAALALEVDEAEEGLSLVLTDWRFKLRVSTVEPVICLCVESRGDVALMQAKTTELLEQIDGKGTESVGA